MDEHEVRKAVEAGILDALTKLLWVAVVVVLAIAAFRYPLPATGLALACGAFCAALRWRAARIVVGLAVGVMLWRSGESFPSPREPGYKLSVAQWVSVAAHLGALLESVILFAYAVHRTWLMVAEGMKRLVSALRPAAADRPPGPAGPRRP